MVRPLNPLIKRYEIQRDLLDARVDELFSRSAFEAATQEQIKTYKVDDIVTGKIVHVGKDDVTIDIGYKSEGVVDCDEWQDDPEAFAALKPGADIEVLIDAFDEDSGMVILSKRKADRIRAWERVIKKYKEGDEVTGKVVRKIKGGLLVDIGVLAFLPASQVSNRRVKDITEYMDQELTCQIIKIDEDRMNIVVSRRKLIEIHRDMLKRSILGEIQEGQVREGVVKNIAEFGAFVDLGGIDGLLHITDMSWGRISHPSEVVAVDQKLEVMVLKVDRERERIALGLKQLSPSPWEKIEERYPVGARVQGQVVNVMSYGAFVKLEEGIEGLVHISEMSWVKRIQHPSELVNKGDEVEVVVLGINKEKEEISLGMKQVTENPWNTVADKYPVNQRVSGKVRNLTTYGAFVELEEGIDGLLHVSDMSWTRKVGHPSEVVKKGEEIECVVLSVDVDKKRIALGLKQLAQDPWEVEIPGKYLIGSIFRGDVTKITNFGVFVELEAGLEGLLHISELTNDRKISSPEEVVKVGQKLDVKIIRVDPKERKIGLTLAVSLEEQNLEGDEPSSALAGRDVTSVPAPAAASASDAAPSRPQQAPPPTSSLGAALAEAMAAKQSEREEEKKD
ncbi:MAG: 30S ribosomal protein S1 [Planctomycetota bacterium]